LDLDGFKPVNDEHGHDVGDELLVAVARRLQGHVRATDLVARLGGDEFVVVASALESPAQAHDLANKLLDAFHAPFTLSSTKVQVGLTIGYALAPLDAYDATSLLKLADARHVPGKTERQVPRAAQHRAVGNALRACPGSGSLSGSSGRPGPG
jgi:diguanylate cyclase (GGDEF)-like protein